MATIFDSVITSKLDGAQFSFYTDQEIQKLSMTEIFNPVAYDEVNHPNKHGICDPAMGVSAMDKLSTCET
jgi:DNA-directed RNA polymerase I subunit RPA1